MKAHIVLAHPEAKSFNGHLAGLGQDHLGSAGWEVSLSDLYAMNFDPREGAHHYTSRSNDDVFHAQTEQRHSADHDSIPADVQAEMERLMSCDLLVVHFPLWWFGMPAILKGWIDRVFVYGRMYKSDLRYDTGVCSGKRMIACVTTGASADSCAHDGREGDTRLHLWPCLFPFRYVGFDVLEPVILHGIGGVAFVEGHEDGTDGFTSLSRTWTGALDNIAKRRAIPYNRNRDFDDTKRLLPDAPSYTPFIAHTSQHPWG